MKDNPVKALAALGQSIWLDYIRTQSDRQWRTQAIDRGGWAARDDLETSHL